MRSWFSLLLVCVTINIFTTTISESPLYIHCVYLYFILLVCCVQITSLKVEPIIRGGLKRFTDMIGQLWCSLADYYIRAGHFEKARDIYEEAIQTVTTVRDFGQVFDAYAQFEESMISAKMETTAEMGPSEDGEPLI